MNFDAFFLVTSFIAGLLTILAPCVLPLLPVIVGGGASSRNKWYPIILTISLSLSIIAFTLLLKASTLLIDIPQNFWKYVSGGILVIFGLTWLFPKLWENVSERLNLLGRSQTGLAKARKVESMWGAVLMGAALGPVFSSCSPTYFVILAVVLPVNFLLGFLYLLIYGLGLALMLGLIAFFGQKITKKLGWVADSQGLFKKIMGFLLILVGLSIITGLEKKIETAILDKGFGVTSLEERLLKNMEDTPEGKAKIEAAMDGTGLPKLYPAPELVGLENWINHPPISSMEELKGKVVLVDFWTYSCINCIRTLPYLESWHRKYADDGLVILAVHAPEFIFERKFENVEKAVRDFGITYPVVQDNEKILFRKAYKNKYWPAKYLIDKEGFVRYTHYGEGKYEETEKYIAALLKVDVEKMEVQAQTVDFKKIGTPETYTGSRKRENFVQDPQANLKEDEWTLKGEWAVSDENAMTKNSGDSIRMKFNASKANLVIGGTGTASVLVDGKKVNTKDVKDGLLKIDGYRLYELADYSGNYDLHEIEVIFDQPNIELYAWTFG